MDALVSVVFPRFPVILSESMENLLAIVCHTVSSNPSSTSRTPSQIVIGQAHATSTPAPVCRHFHCLRPGRSTPAIHPTEVRMTNTRCASSDIYASYRSSETATHSHLNLVPVFPSVFVFEVSIVAVEEAQGIGSGGDGTRRDSALLKHRQTRRMHLMEACVYGVSPCALPTRTFTDSSSPQHSSPTKVSFHPRNNSYSYAKAPSFLTSQGFSRSRNVVRVSQCGRKTQAADVF